MNVICWFKGHRWRYTSPTTRECGRWGCDEAVWYLGLTGNWVHYRD